MSIKKWLITIALAFFLYSPAVFSEDLMQVYYQALASDPTFKSAEAQYLANRENLPIARSALLPNIIITGTSQRQRIEQNANEDIFDVTGVSYNTLHDYILSLSQPIFNYSAWYSVRNATYEVRQAAATFCAATQDLIVRTAQAYFNVLLASDTLRYTQMQKSAVAEQLRQTRDQYEVGLIAITGLKEAQANYDSLIAQEIAAKNSLSNAVEQLRTITGSTYCTLVGTHGDLPLTHPQPYCIDSWVQTAQSQNYQLQAAINAVNAAQENIKVQFGGHLPVVNAVSSVEYNEESNPANANLGSLTQTTISGGVALNFPIYQGGLVSAQTKQAFFLYQQAIAQMDFTHRSIMEQTRNSFLGVLTGISKIRADQATVISSQVALQATKNGYEAGTRTMLDVLISQSTLYQAQLTFSQDQYNYLMSIITLKQAAGTLGPNDLAEINCWLHDHVDVSPAIYDLETPQFHTALHSRDDAVLPLPNRKNRKKVTHHRKKVVAEKCSCGAK